MSERSLTLKYRPQFFRDIVGQEIIAKTLSRAVAVGKIHSAYLFHGPRGSGKTSMARIFAKVLNCQSRAVSESVYPIEACGACVSCQDITDGRSLDVLEIDAASHTGVEHVREVILDTINLAPARDPCRVFIIDEVHMLSTSAFNAMLKTLEEPPDHVVFILATTELVKVPVTIVSRTQSFPFRVLPQSTIRERLEFIAKRENIPIEDQASEAISREAGGSLRDAVSLLEQLASLSEPGGTLTYDRMVELLGFVEETLLNDLTESLVLSPNAIKAKEAIHHALYSIGYAPGRFLAAMHAHVSRRLIRSLEEAQTVEYGHRLYDFFRHLSSALTAIRTTPDPLVFCEVELMGYLLNERLEVGSWKLEGGNKNEKLEGENKKEEKFRPQTPRTGQDIIVGNETISWQPRQDAASLGVQEDEHRKRAATPPQAPGNSLQSEENILASSMTHDLPPIASLEDWQAKFQEFLAAAKSESWSFYFEGSVLERKSESPLSFIVKLGNSFHLKGVQNHQEKVKVLWKKFFEGALIEFSLGAPQPIEALAAKPEEIPEDVKKMAELFGGKIKRIVR